MPKPLTMQDLFNRYREVLVLDCEYATSSTLRPDPVSAVCHELKSGRRHDLWLYNKVTEIENPPWPNDDKTLMVTWYGLAEFSVFHAMGWKLPRVHLDLFTWWKWFKNGRVMRVNGSSLLDAAMNFNIGTMSSGTKDFWRDLIISRGWTPDQIEGILNYNTEDVIITTKLFKRVVPYINLKQELNRGEYIKALSLVEARGIPIDLQSLREIQESWPALKQVLIDEANKIWPFYKIGSFNFKEFKTYLAHNKIAWKRTASGRPSTDDDYLKARGIALPEIEQLRQVRKTLSKGGKKLLLPVGSDARNRFMMSPFGQIGGRNNPSTTANVFGNAKWFRQLIQPSPGMALAYIDWTSQEYGVQAFLSQDPVMMRAYDTSCPYLFFGKKIHRIPENATKLSHPRERSILKRVSLALGYGQGSKSLAHELNIIHAEAQSLIRHHKRTFRVFWEWMDDTVSKAMLLKKMVARCGWQFHVRCSDRNEYGQREPVNQRTLMNWSCQANASEMMRLATILSTREGIKICGIVHDAFLIEDRISDIEATVAKTQECMEKASRIVLRGHALRSDAQVFRYPERFPESSGLETWDIFQRFLSDNPQPSLPLP